MGNYNNLREGEDPMKPMPEGIKERNEEPDDTQGNQFILDVESNRAIARGREREIQRSLRTESKRPFFRRGR